jgi:hypothetical protein
MFQFKNLNIEYNPDKYYIEFWWRNDVYRSFHIDCDEKYRKETNKYLLPLLSNIVYLSDSHYATILTNIDLEDYKYKEFNNNISVSLSKKGKIVSFDSKYFHGVSDIFENIDSGITTQGRSALMINLWDKKPKDILYYKESENNIFHKNNTIKFIKEPDPQYIKYNVKYEELLEKLLYEKCYSVLYDFGKEIYKKYNTTNFMINNSTFMFSNKDNTKSSNESIIISPKQKCENKIQSFFIKNSYSYDICQWILFEMKEKNNIEIVKNMVIFNFILLSLNNTILPKIQNKYQIVNVMDVRNIYFSSNIDIIFKQLSDESSMQKYINGQQNNENNSIYIIIALEELTIVYINNIYILDIGDIFIIKNKNIKVDEKRFLFIIIS